MSTIETATDRDVIEVGFDHLSWLDSKDAAKYLRKTANALRIMVYRGYIRPRKFHRRLYFRRLELDRMLESSAF
ncbi:helix-turn-helix domain-containing protein [Bdellovibrionota bacterium FG-2]